eukprot:m.129712 g.129712  ORF g.129712 m.129712 type:complete len:275 (+) comp37985_c0_seq8:127-951(+)
MSVERLDIAAVVPQGVQLTIQSGNLTSRYSLPCQWLSLNEKVTIPKAREELLLADASTSTAYKHIALVEMNQEMNFEEEIADCQQNIDARGAIFVHFSDQLPAENQSLSSDFSIPVVLVQRSPGLHLLQDTSDDSKTVMVHLTKERTIDESVPKYHAITREPKKGHPDLGVAQLELKSQVKFRRKSGFRFCRQLKELLLDKPGQYYIIHTDPVRLCQVFQLFDDFEGKCSANQMSNCYIKKKIKKATKLFIECVSLMHSTDLPFHLLISWRLHR